MYACTELLYQWEKLHALASDRRNQSQEVKTMYATFMTVEGVVAEGIAQLEHKRFRSLDELRTTVLEIQVCSLQCNRTDVKNE